MGVQGDVGFISSIPASRATPLSLISTLFGQTSELAGPTHRDCQLQHFFNVPRGPRGASGTAFEGSKWVEERLWALPCQSGQLPFYLFYILGFYVNKRVQLKKEL